MSTAGFCTKRSTESHTEGDAEHLLCSVSINKLRVGTRLVLNSNVEALLVEVFEFFDSFLEFFAFAENTDLSRHDFLHASADLSHVFFAIVLNEGVQFGLFALDEVVNNAGRNVDGVFRLVAEVSDCFADDHTGNNGFSNGVTAETVKAVHIPASSFTGSEQALQSLRFAVRVGADTAHGVVLSRANRDPILRRVNAEEVMADFVNFTKVVFNVVFTEPLP